MFFSKQKKKKKRAKKSAFPLAPAPKVGKEFRLKGVLSGLIYFEFLPLPGGRVEGSKKTGHLSHFVCRAER